MNLSIGACEVSLRICRRTKFRVLLCTALLAAGCGQTGPLLPAERAPAAAGENVDTGVEESQSDQDER
jgi:predicted small lipoprotein YifL